MFKVNTSELDGLSKDLGTLSRAELDAALTQGLYIAGAGVQKAARGMVAVDTGALRISVANDPIKGPDGPSQQIGPTQPYGYKIEYGQPPGTYVSPAALAGWAKRKGLNPYAVSKSIFKKGSPPQPFMFPAGTQEEPNIVKTLTQAVLNAFAKAFKV